MKNRIPLYLILLLGTILFIPLPALASSFSGLDYPIGSPNGGGYYDAQDFGEWNPMFRGYHLGEDWNKSCSGDCDLGDPVVTAAEGVVAFARFQKVWGNVVIIRHTLNSGLSVDTFYGHLTEINVKEGQTVGRGIKIGGIGKGDGDVYPAHLHFELRDKPNLGVGTGYGKKDLSGWTDPSFYINSHRPPMASILTATAGEGKVTLSWTKSDDSRFERYEIYRSSSAGGTADPSQRTLVSTVTDPATLTAADDKVPIGISYYRLITYFKNGLTAESAEVSVENKRQITTIVTGNGYQANPTIIDGRVYFEDFTPNGASANKKLFWYDLKTGQTDGADIPLNMNYANQPKGSGAKVAYYSYTKQGCYRAFYYDFGTGQNMPVSIGDSSCSQMNPDISDRGIVVWQQLGLDGTQDVYFNDTSGAVGPQKIATTPGHQINPRVFGDTIVWKDKRVGSYDLYAKNLSNGTEERLATGVGDGPADIWGDWVIWEYRGKITLINIKTKEQKTVVATGAGYNPTINEGKVAYTLQETGGSYVHVYDVATGADTKIDFMLHVMSYPSYGEGYVVWDDTVGTIPNNKDIFLTKL